MSIKQLLNKFNSVSAKKVGAILLTLGLIPCAFADAQVLSGMGDVIKTNFSGNAIIWGVFLLGDFVIAAMAYAATKKPSVFFSTFILLIVVKVFVGLIITSFFGS